ncbi:MAG: UDP-N-acetylmuramate dehydrogenase [Deltaproteobacteria bacterium]|nr:UDP-N-acetylmuramate dehydrogenase [Deltaproteobacteria bacterium]
MIPAAVRESLERAFGDRVAFDVSLARHTSLLVGGPADAIATPADRAELSALLRLCREHHLPHQLLGSGFNTLVRDGGIDGVLVRLAKLRRLEERPGARLRAEAGVSHSQITRFCSGRGLSGFEFGAGVPGTVGGWLAMNAGVPQQAIGSRVEELEVMSPSGRCIRHLPRSGLRFVYRALRGLAPGSVLLSALLSVTLSTPSAVREEVDRQLSRRAGTQPLDIPTCGSVFKNPPGDHAGRLIEAAGLKGHRIGGAEFSPMHANFIANTGGASASDVLALIEHAQKTVLIQSGILLAPEVRVIGRPI